MGIGLDEEGNKGMLVMFGLMEQAVVGGRVSKNDAVLRCH
jgi:hypothetical protein